MKQEFDPEGQFIARMARERKQRGWTLEKLASEVARVSEGRVQMHQSAFTKLEREEDRRNLRLNEAYYIALALERTMRQMLTNDDQLTAQERIQGLEAELAGLRAKRHDAWVALNFVLSQELDLEGELRDLLERHRGLVRSPASEGKAPATKATVKPHKVHKEAKPTTRVSRRG